ncbi:sulfatase-like hydrolase/transferase [Pusillimonas noertemannii]|uniref:sulfatase-like hydrolase/transferase n=1 Tax=Pusillimonas noertemannii TaxID=305977 RepID=UPI0002FE811F|nr:sulfatase-like hydrolase/transferase [Pusillimonas noertemannii]
MKKTQRRKLSTLLLATTSALALAGCSGGSDPKPQPPTALKSNILFIVLDDLGLDQLAFYGYGGAVPPKTPNLAAIAQAGLQFRQAWAMPTCTPTRATFFTGRYPSSTNVLNAVVSTDLANSEISPYEMTLPKLLDTQGYTSALIGKMHLTGTDLDTAANLPYGHKTMWKLGWDYFDGYLDGAPFPIDTRAGLSNVAEGTYKCGFVSNTTMDKDNGADFGACYAAAGGCESISRGEDIPTPGRSCMERGGIFDPGQSCQATTPSYIDFDTQNGYYTGEFVQSWPDGRTNKVTASDPSARGYRSTMETDRAVAWAKQQSGDTPWMMSVGYSAIHAPLQLPPLSLISDTTPGRNDNLLCSPASDIEGAPIGQLTDLVDSHIITNLMVEAMDTEIGRLLVELDLATWNDDGTLNYQPEKTNTIVVVMGDNGTYVNSVKFTEPGRFDPTRAKGFAYQTGVSVPLLVAGPMVKDPGREITHQVSSPDLYRLFAEIAGADVDAIVPANRPVDAQPMLAYLTDPGQGPIRTLNFAEMGTNFTNPATSITPQPCVIEAANVCFTIFPNKALCDDQSGIWYGVNSGLADVPAEGFSQCGQVMSYRQGLDAGDKVDVLPDSQKAVSDGQYKLVRLNRKIYSIDTADPVNSTYVENQNTDELYKVDMAVPNPTLDREGSAIATGSPTITAPLPAEAQQAYAVLKAEMDERDQVASYNYQYDKLNCPGDGNRDGVVDQRDLDNWTELSQLNLYKGVAQSSWYDFNHDGKTDDADRAIIEAGMGMDCPSSPA